MVGRGPGPCSLLHEVAGTRAGGVAAAALQPADGGGVCRVGAAVRAVLRDAASGGPRRGGCPAVSNIAGHGAGGRGGDAEPSGEFIGVSVQRSVGSATGGARRGRAGEGAGAVTGRVV